MALVGSISGSNSLIGVSGSVIFANRPDSLFPASLPGADVSFFVSGSRESKGGSSRTVAVFGGDTVVSGNLTVGTGSVTITSNEIQFQGGAAKIVSGSSGLTFFDSGNTSGVTLSTLVAGGGGGSSFFSSPLNGKLNSTGSLSLAGALGASHTTANVGSDVFFFVSGSTADGSNNALFGGQLISSGTLKVKNSSGTVVASISNGGVISGSSDLQAGGTLTVAGATTLNGNVTLGDATSDVITVTGQVSGSLFDINGGTIDGTAIGASNPSTGVFTTLSATGNTTLGDAATDTTTVAGSLAVNGTAASSTNKITSTQTAFNLLNDTVTTLNIGGDATTVSLGAGSGTTTVNNNLTVTGDLTVNGTTTTIDTTNLLVEDPIILMASGTAGPNRNGGIAIFSGSADTTAAGARTELVFGRVAADTWGAGKINTSNGTLTDLTGMSLLPVRASKFELGGTTAFVTSSNGTTLTAQGSIVEIKTTTGAGVIDFNLGGTSFINFTSANGAVGGAAKFGAVSGKNLVLSGTKIEMNAGALGFTLLRDDVSIAVMSGTTGTGGGFRVAAQEGSVLRELTLSGSLVTIGANSGTTTIKGGTLVGDQTTQNLFNTVATTLNIGGFASTLLNMGHSSGATHISGSVTIPGTLAAIGNVTLGDNAASDTITFTGQAASSLIPNLNNAYDLGSASLRWRNMFTGDLHLKNERGDWTIIEEEDYLTITNNKNGKRYKFMMEEI